MSYIISKIKSKLLAIYKSILIRSIKKAEKEMLKNDFKLIYRFINTTRTSVDDITEADIRFIDFILETTDASMKNITEKYNSVREKCLKLKENK